MSDKLSLVKPNETHEKVYNKLISDWQRQDLPRLLAGDYSSYIEVLLAFTRRARGDVPYSTYLLMDGSDAIGVVAIRHTLDRFMQEFGGHISYSITPERRGTPLEKELVALCAKTAREDLGLSSLVVSFGTGNTPMREAVEANGGELYTSNEKNGIDYMTYKIKLSA